MHRSPECAKGDTVSRLSTSVLNIHISCSISVKKTYYIAAFCLVAIILC